MPPARPDPRGYVPLACHSWYSFLWGTDPIASLCEAVAGWKGSALALTDINGVYGALTFWEEARAAGLAPLVGADARPASGPGAVLLAAGVRGYRRLCRILTELHHGAAHLDRLLKEDREGLWTLVSDPALLEDLARETGPA
ncbi:MAG TPA: PHP domain-containing protein, partial [Candidatus Polarisedimenticolia bacterium]|nr:PHP domain-containing protein [Candidatus Polarisedimenticolia bacterium]